MADNEKGVASAREHVSGQANTHMSRPAHALSYTQVIQELGGDAANGLSTGVAQQRLNELGMNVLGESEGVSPLKIVIAQIANAMTLVRLTKSTMPMSKLTKADVLRSSSWPWPSVSVSDLGLKELLSPLSSSSMWL